MNRFYRWFGIAFGLAMVCHYFLVMVVLPTMLERWLADPIDPDQCTIAEQRPLR